MPQKPALKDLIPPHNEDAERAVLGAMLLENEAANKAALKLKQDDFYSLANGKIFNAVRNILAQGGRRADIISVCDELGRLNELDAAGGEAYISSLTGVVPTTANIDYYIEQVRDGALRRALITIASKISAKSYDVSQNAQEVIEKSQQFIYELIEERRNFKYQSIRNVITNTIPYLESTFENEYTGIRCGFSEIDEKTKGFQKQEMIVIGARPSIGKTALALNMAANIAFQHRIPTAFFSLEMKDILIGARLLAAESSIDLKSVRSHLTSDDEKKPHIQSNL
ncbi:MAG: hypothetical protein Pg6A_18490 [Termitinemataceae bacterium]|nr:MAG: hypothetical protein Pg6A_18490 [Termitinemataceae bacterium]